LGVGGWGLRSGVGGLGLGATAHHKIRVDQCSSSKAGSYLRRIDFLSLNSRLESNKGRRKDMYTRNVST